MPRRIEDYALLGDTQTAALVSKTGSIDWLCLPRFDSEACFASLLGTEEHGLWRISPRGRVTRVQRRYRGRSLVLETEFETADGVIRVVDCMPPRNQTPDLVRVVEGVRGNVPVEMLFRARFGYGLMRPWIRTGHNCMLSIAGPDSLGLHTPVAVEHAHGDITARFTVGPSDRVPFVLTWSPSHIPLPKPVDAAHALGETELWWQQWISHSTYEGEWKEAVDTSLVALKALTYLPTGGIVAAATTSLPEELGGVRNWDYRFCWLRDATFTLLALLDAGFEREAHAWRDWLLRAVAGDPSQLQIMYGAAGERRLPEMELPWLPGFENSAPVRVGNAAVDQFQLDVYGEVIDVLHQARLFGIAEEEPSWALQRALVGFVEENWDKRDQGLWEVRGRQRHFTHSKVMAWVAMDRVIHAAQNFQLEATDLQRWISVRDRIHRDVLERGFNPRAGAFTQYYGSRELDASLLLIPLVGFLPARDPRVRGTVEAIGRELNDRGFIKRYNPSRSVEGLSGSEGTFLACTFWYADNLYLLGREAEARAIFERLLAIRNDVGLMAEEYDPRHKRHLGNFPQAFSHVSLVNTARLLVAGKRASIERRAEEGAER